MSSFHLGMSISWKENHTRTEARVNHKAIRCNQTRSGLKTYRNGNNVNAVPPDGTVQTYFKPYHGPINTTINFNLIYFICLQIIWNNLFYLKFFPSLLPCNLSFFTSLNYSEKDIFLSLLMIWSRILEFILLILQALFSGPERFYVIHVATVLENIIGKGKRHFSHIRALKNAFTLHLWKKIMYF